MLIHKADFITSSANYNSCPSPNKPEHAFIGRSNVGKSSLLNMLCDRRKLAKISSTPGKTRLINHFEINQEWYMVDLPGYGYAKLPISEKEKFRQMISGYLYNRPNLVNLFVLVDSRHKPQSIDLEFMRTMGLKQVPFSIVFTKIDKLKPEELEVNLANYKKELMEEWDELPPLFCTSSSNKQGRDEILKYIDSVNHGLL
jgi:GTP-binding protein